MDFKCPWCGCCMHDEHSECKKAAQDQYNEVLALKAALDTLISRPVRYVDNENPHYRAGSYRRHPPCLNRQSDSVIMIVREERIGQCRLLLGDCLPIMPTLGPVDCVITDPPYEQSSAGPGSSHFGMSLSKFDGAAYKAIVSGVDYGTLLAAVAGICNPFNMFCFCSNKQISKLMMLNEASDRSTTLLVWHKTNAAPFANGVWRGDLEYIVHARSAGAVFQGGAEEKKKVTEHPIVVDDAHPTVKPRSIIHKYIRIGSKPGQTILDPFLGSGTTLVACAKLGRAGVGIEIDPAYFDVACRRVEEAYRQPDLFVEPSKPPVQEVLFL